MFLLSTEPRQNQEVGYLSNSRVSLLDKYPKIFITDIQYLSMISL